MAPPSRSSISNPIRRRFPIRSGGCSIFSSADLSQSSPMKASNVLIYAFYIVGALAGYFLLMPPLSWTAVGTCAVFAAWTLLATDPESRTVLRLAGLSWSMEDFVRGWLITGRTGSGKTQCAINSTHPRPAGRDRSPLQAAARRRRIRPPGLAACAWRPDAECLRQSVRSRKTEAPTIGPQRASRRISTVRLSCRP
jgi:hypothetical protein